MLEEIKWPKFQKLEKEMKNIYKMICAKSSKTFSFLHGFKNHSRKISVDYKQNAKKIIQLMQEKIKTNFVAKIPANVGITSIYFYFLNSSIC